ncbi:hypothetical protein [Caudoviricetes sp.]|nr:hypothetical protein [Caudoviricetes sp.]
MAITTLDGYIAAGKQDVLFIKTTTTTTVANSWFSVFNNSGDPGAGTLGGSSTTAGVVPTDATAGTPTINTGTGKYYLTLAEFASTVACRLRVSDLLFKAGAYSFNSNVTLSAQPSYSSRVPGGTDYKGTQIWLETVTAFTGNQSILVTYTNQDGTTGRSTGTIATGVAPISKRMLQLPLQAGDTGVQKIESVVSTVSTVGTFNVLVLRPLWTGRVPIANFGDTYGLDRTGMPQVFPDSALYVSINADSTSSGIPELRLQIASA